MSPQELGERIHAVYRATFADEARIQVSVYVSSANPRIESTWLTVNGWLQLILRQDGIWRYRYLLPADNPLLRLPCFARKNGFEVPCDPLKAVPHMMMDEAHRRAHLALGDCNEQGPPQDLHAVADWQPLIKPSAN